MWVRHRADTIDVGTLYLGLEGRFSRPLVKKLAQVMPRSGIDIQKKGPEGEAFRALYNASLLASAI